MRNRSLWIVALLALAIGFAAARLRRDAASAPTPVVDPGASAQQAARPSPPPLEQWRRLVATGRASNATRHVEGLAQTQVRAPLPEGPFGTNVAQLKQLAQGGDAGAAATLAQGFRDCEFFRPVSREESMKHVEERSAHELALIDALSEQAQRAAAQQGKQVTLPQPSTRDVMQGQLAAQRDYEERCGSVDTDEARRDWAQWLRRAAQLGDTDTQLAFWQFLLQHAEVETFDELAADKQLALAALQDAYQRGDPRALAAIGKVLSLGVFAQPDDYSAYAFLYAAAQAPAAKATTLPWMRLVPQWFAFGTTHDYLAREMHTLEASLTAAQRLDAQQAGLALYQQCCSGTAQ